MKFIKALLILLKAFFWRKDVYQIHFIKVNKLWYCDIPHWPRAFFDNAQMVGGAAGLLNTMAKDKNEILIEVVFKEKHLSLPANHYNKARKTGSQLWRGAFYDVLSLDFLSSIWICPVTLFVFGKYPEYIYFREIHS